MTKVKIRFESPLARDTLIKLLSPNIYYINKTKFWCNYFRASCPYGCIYVFDLSKSETAEIIYTAVRKTLMLWEEPYSIDYIKEIK